MILYRVSYSLQETVGVGVDDTHVINFSFVPEIYKYAGMMIGAHYNKICIMFIEWHNTTLGIKITVNVILNDRSWISPWMNPISDELDVFFDVLALK